MDEETGGRSIFSAATATANSDTSTIVPASISPSSSGDRNEIESQRSRESCFNSIFESAPTKAEADYSMVAFQSFMDHEGPRMLVENPEFQIAQDAFQFMKLPMVQEMVISVMCDGGVIAAMLRNNAVQAFLQSLMFGNSARLTNGTTAANTEGSDNMVLVIMRWLLENMECGILGICGSLRSFVNSSTFESPQLESIDSASSKRAIGLTLFLSVTNLLIVFVRRALKRNLMS